MDEWRHDKNLYWTALIYFFGLLLLGIVWWKAVAVTIVASVCWFLTYGRQMIIGVGLAILILGLGNWIGLLPTPSEWGQLFAMMAHR